MNAGRIEEIEAVAAQLFAKGEYVPAAMLRELLAENERLTGLLDAARGLLSTSERGDAVFIEHLTAERDSLRAQLQQAQDAANAALQEEHAARLVLEERLKAAEQRETALQEMIADTSTQAATTPSA